MVKEKGKHSVKPIILGSKMNEKIIWIRLQSYFSRTEKSKKANAQLNDEKQMIHGSFIVQLCSENKKEEISLLL